MIPSSGRATVLSRRDRIVISSCLVLLTALAWAYLIRLDRGMSAAMEHDQMMADMGMVMDMPWKATDVILGFAMWAVMMVGMMTPSAAPIVLLFAGMRSGSGAQRVPGIVLAFGAGYLLVWVLFSAVATLAQWALLLARGDWKQADEVLARAGLVARTSLSTEAHSSSSEPEPEPPDPDEKARRRLAGEAGDVAAYVLESTSSEAGGSGG